MTRVEFERVAARLRQGWCRGTFARDMNGLPTSARMADAVSWCVVGACMREGVRLPTTDLRSALAVYNDLEARSVEEVITYLETHYVEDGKTAGPEAS